MTFGTTLLILPISVIPHTNFKTCSNTLKLITFIVFRDSSVGIVTRCGLEGMGIESLCGGRDFPRTGSHTDSYIMGTGALPGVKRPESDDHQHLRSVKGYRMNTDMPLIPTSAFVACSRVIFTFTINTQHV